MGGNIQQCGTAVASSNGVQQTGGSSHCGQSETCKTDGAVARECEYPKHVVVILENTPSAGLSDGAGRQKTRTFVADAVVAFTAPARGLNPGLAHTTTNKRYR